MIPYFVLIFIPIIFAILFSKSNDKRRYTFPLILFFGTLLIMLALRSTKCGTDLPNYIRMFNLAGRDSWINFFDLSITESGYRFLEKLCYSISTNFNVFLTIVALISIVPIFVFYLKECDDPILTIALFITVAPFSMFFSGLRQSIAIGLGIIAFNFINKKKIVLFLITVFIAFLFHQSALVLLLLLILRYMKLTKKWIIPLAAVFVICIIFNKQIFNFAITIFSSYGERYNTVTQSTNAYTMLILLVLFVVYSFVIPEESEIDSMDFFLRNILILSMLIQCFAPVHPLAMRFNYYFLVFIPITIPRIASKAKTNNIGFAAVSKWVMSLTFVIYFFVNAYFGSDILSIFPYVPFW